jgi:hypothetical protein
MIPLIDLIPAQAAIRFAAVTPADTWVPAFAGTTVTSRERQYARGSESAASPRGRIHPRIAWAKLDALVQGAELATMRFWR